MKKALSRAKRLFVGVSLCVFTSLTLLFGLNNQSAFAYPYFAQEAYKTPREATGKIVCANCHLAKKGIELELPQAVKPDSVFEAVVKVPYDHSKQQVAADGSKTGLNIGAVLVLPEGFKIAPEERLSEELKEKTKDIYYQPYSDDQENIVLVGPISGDEYSEIVFPVVAPDPDKDSDVKYLTYPFYAGGNRGRGQVYPTGERSNINSFGATQAGQITEITNTEKGESKITIVNSDGVTTSQTLSAGLQLLVKQGDIVKVDQPLNIDPNVGGFGQEESEIVLQSSARILGYLAFCFCLLVTQVLLVLKMKQYEKVQAAELNF